MSQKDIDQLASLAREKLKNMTPEEALRSLMAAGILDEDTHFTSHYKHLEKVVIRK